MNSGAPASGFDTTCRDVDLKVLVPYPDAEADEFGACYRYLRGLKRRLKGGLTQELEIELREFIYDIINIFEESEAATQLLAFAKRIVWEHVIDTHKHRNGLKMRSRDVLVRIPLPHIGPSSMLSVSALHHGIMACWSSRTVICVGLHAEFAFC